MFQPGGSKSGGLPLQLKSSSCHNLGSSEYYLFSWTSGYDGILLVLIALVTLGSPREEAWRVDKIGLVLAEYFRNSSLPHVPLPDSILQCSGSNIVEEHSHPQLVSVFESVGYRFWAGKVICGASRRRQRICRRMVGTWRTCGGVAAAWADSPTKKQILTSWWSRCWTAQIVLWESSCSTALYWHNGG
ncbi:unnamed protein product [Symbiodinium necroappetens]|uniref:Uncharacterized protein n=1 Tax=Symbiodinium necroappetens TaxID=1628268 RepID=A0A813CC71_9DINO|nr:unnamed protein product [Symbiodinium necroappetens]